MKPNRIRHDVSYATALALQEVVGPHLADMDEKELFSKAYTAVVGAIEKFEELKADEKRRLSPTSQN